MDMERTDVKDIARTLAKSRPLYDGETDTPEWLQWCKTVDDFLAFCKKEFEFNYRFTEQAFIDLCNASEACPGCGCKPGDGITANCYHPGGCGFWRTQEDE